MWRRGLSENVPASNFSILFWAKCSLLRFPKPLKAPGWILVSWLLYSWRTSRLCRELKTPSGRDSRPELASPRNLRWFSPIHMSTWRVVSRVPNRLSSCRSLRVCKAPASIFSRGLNPRSRTEQLGSAGKSPAKAKRV